MSEIDQLRELLHQKADIQARIKLIPYDGAPEIKTQGAKQYLYVRKRIGGRNTSTYVDLYSETLYQLLLKNAREKLQGESNSISNQELICKGWFLPPNTYMTAAHLW